MNKAAILVKKAVDGKNDLIFNLTTNLKHSKNTIIIDILYNWKEDEFIINNILKNKDKVVYTSSLVFKNFREDYGIPFIEGFIRYLIGDYEIKEDICITNAPLPESTYGFGDFYYIEGYQDSFTIGKETAFGIIKIEFCLLDEELEEYEYETKNDELVSALQMFLKKLYKYKKDMVTKEEEENVKEATFDLAIGKIEINEKTITIYHEEEVDMINRVPAEAKLNGLITIPVEAISDNFVEEVSEDDHIYTLNTSCGDTFELVFREEGSIVKFVKILKRIK